MTAGAVRPPFITTSTGRRFYPLDPDPNEIHIVDVAHALAHQCRYSGHTRVHYSVAEHSVRVSELIEAWGADRTTQLWGLLHDASEAYLIDLPSPLKHCEQQFPTFLDALKEAVASVLRAEISTAIRIVISYAYRAAEKTLMAAVCTRFALPIEEPHEIREADMKLLATEVRDLMPPGMETWSGLTHGPLPDTIVPWLPDTARTRFLDRFKELTQ